MFDQLRHGQHTGPQARIIRIDLKDNSFDDLAGRDLGRELLNSTQHDTTVDCLPAGSISPSKFPYTVSASALGLYKASVLYAAPFCTGALASSAGAGSHQIPRLISFRGNARIEVTGGCCFAAAALDSTNERNVPLAYREFRADWSAGSCAPIQWIICGRRCNA